MTQEDENKDDSVLDIDQNKDYLQDLVGEGKKFSDPKALAKGKFESDQYIRILERRLDEMRKDYLEARDENTSKAGLEDLINQIKQSESKTPPAKEEHQPVLDPKQIEILVSNKMQDIETSRQQTLNSNLVKDRLQERFGPDFRDKVLDQISDLGLSEKEFNDLARKQPKVLLRTLGLERTAERDPFQSPPTSRQRSDNFAPKSPEKRTWSYYQKLKQENPKAWLDRKIAIQMQEDAIQLGTAFEDGDFHKQGLH